jgi:Flp pilus assembly protein TadD
MRLRASIAPTWTVPVTVSLVTAGMYLTVLRAGFVDWDDTALLVHNSAYRGFGEAQLRWMLTSDLLGHYAPVTWLSFALDYRVWGLTPLGFHLTNLLLHAANAGLVVLLARRLLGAAMALSVLARTIGAAAAALFFGLHPLRVESVAWVTERRGLLSALFFLLTVLAYLAGADVPGVRRRTLLAVSVATFALALGAKASVMTLPVILVLLDVYPLRRLPSDPRRWLTPELRDAWLEKIPYAILGSAGAAAAYLGQSSGADAHTLAVSEWLGKLAQGLWFYAYRTVFPFRLSPLYEFPREMSLAGPEVLVGAAGVAAVSVVAWAGRRACPGLLAAWLYSLIMVAPFMGITHVGFQLFADRYSYLPSLGWALLGGALAAALANAWEAGRIGARAAGLGAVVGVAALVFLGALTIRQIAVWRDPGTLWVHAISLDTDCSLCHAQLGIYLLERGSPQAALAQFDRTVALRPDRVRVRIPMAEALVQVGRLDEAVVELRRVLARYPELLPSRLLLAETLVRLGRPEEAATELRGATKAASPSDVAAYLENTRGRKPDSAVVRAGLVYAYLALDRPDLARTEREALERLTPVAARLAGPRPP